MRNCDLYTSVTEAKKYYEVYCGLFNANTEYQVGKLPDILAWLFRPADTALRLKPGTLVQIVRDHTMEYAMVISPVWRMNDSCAQYCDVSLRNRKGNIENWLVSDYIGAPEVSLQDLERRHSSIKIADIPSDLVNLLKAQYGNEIAGNKEEK